VTVKEVIPVGKIGVDRKLSGEIDISFRCYLIEIVRGILLTWQPRKSTRDWKGK